MLSQPLTTRDAAKVGVDHLDRIDVGMRRKKRFCLARRRDGC